MRLKQGHGTAYHRLRSPISEKNLKHEIETKILGTVDGINATISEKNLKHEIETLIWCDVFPIASCDQREESQA